MANTLAGFREGRYRRAQPRSVGPVEDLQAESRLVAPDYLQLDEDVGPGTDCVAVFQDRLEAPVRHDFPGGLCNDLGKFLKKRDVGNLAGGIHVERRLRIPLAYHLLGLGDG